MDKHDIHCAGCGIAIQTTEKEKTGYAPESSLQREVPICQRCYRIKHYNEASTVTLGDDEFVRILNGIGQTHSLVVKVVDIFDFNGSWLRGLPRFVGNNPILLVANKVDLLPKNVNRNRLINWIRKSASDLGLKPVDVILVSARTGTGIERLVEAMNTHRKKRDIYVVGVTNVGKSSLINRLIRQFGESEMDITTSQFPGTTLDVIEIPLDDKSSLYDTPGIVNRDQIVHRVTPAELKLVMPDKPIKPKVYQLKQEQTLFIAGLARVDFVKGENQSFVFYVSNGLNIHRTKLERADEIYANHLGEMLSPPGKEAAESMSRLEKFTFKVPPGDFDLVISGLGWVALHGSGANVAVYVPKGVTASLRPSLI
ncbi:ribosome biogenesis GTPase YqeH [Aneurinibacillus terranovensis]|uniref:ribosome biogenesis GTPase YqeH n=1 Tax=Aneurinibacillus terranovensis TaxID=278991 RepID=UPI0004204F20|nr:ribosome biogenesis GTPase YqeH [Aneurinibacillus terranovensis]